DAATKHDTSIVDENIDRTELRRDAHDQGVDLDTSGNIGAHGDGRAAIRSDRPHHRVGIGGAADIINRHLGALLGQGERDGASDAARSSGDERDTAVEAGGKRHLFALWYFHYSASFLNASLARGT